VTDAVISRARVVDANGAEAERDVVIRDGLIAAVRPAARAAAATEPGRFDASGCYVLPGLVDIHLHGALGLTFNDPDPGAWREILAFHLAAGTTTALPTVMTDGLDALCAALRTARELGMPAHLEGPYLSPQQRGAHPAGLLRAPADGSWPLLAEFLDVVRLVTLAPELAGAQRVIRECARAGVVASVGHSEAGEELLRSARRLGLSHIAHLWSGQSALRKSGPWRHPGLLEAALASDGYTAEVIADGRHLPAVLLQIAYRCLGPGRLCLVSDASAGTGLPPGSEFTMGEAAGVVADGVALTRDGRSFCGSTSTLLDTLRFAVRDAGIPLAGAVRMATATPARILGWGDRVGSIGTGLQADLLIVTGTLDLVAVVSGGRVLEAVEAAHG
jgi:N-acetylglucosamine-6-phosphate deacetylase